MKLKEPVKRVEPILPMLHLPLIRGQSWQAASQRRRTAFEFGMQGPFSRLPWMRQLGAVLAAPLVFVAALESHGVWRRSRAVRHLDARC